MAFARLVRSIRFATSVRSVLGVCVIETLLAWEARGELRSTRPNQEAHSVPVTGGGYTTAKITSTMLQ
eukprot:2001745-Alexandrium_andersonii.AAC.1